MGVSGKALQVALHPTELGPLVRTLANVCCRMRALCLMTTAPILE